MLIFYAVTVFAALFTNVLVFSQDGRHEDIPLKRLDVRGEFFVNLGEVAIKQSWINVGDKPITTKYKFALDANAVVSGYYLKIGEKMWHGVVKAKETARTEFKEAVAAGIKSSVLYKLSDTEYQVEIGPIAPAEGAEVEIKYLTRVPVASDGSYRFTLPTNIAPKYISPHTTNKEDVVFADAMKSIPYVTQPEYKFDLDLTWHTGSNLREIVSPTNAINTEIISPTTARVTCTTAPENGDFTVSVRTAETIGAYVYEKKDGNTYLYVHNQIPAETVTSTGVKKITIVLDRSGSMSGGKIVEAVKAIDTFLSLMTPSDNILLNVVSFGSDHTALYSHSVPTTAHNIENIRHSVSGFGADMGGTDLFPCLQSVFEDNFESFITVSPPLESTVHEHIMVLLTDGQVMNLHSVLELVSHKTDVSSVRIMTIGIGRDADRNLVQQVAVRSNGIHRMLADEVDITAALTDIMSHIDKQYYTNLHILGDYEVVQGSKVLYPANPVDMFLRLTAEQYQEVQRNGLTVSAHSPVHNETKSWHIAVAECVKAGSLLEKLYAHMFIAEKVELLNTWQQSMLSREITMEQVVNLSVQHGIMSKYTSFLIVSDEKVGEEDLNNVQSVEVPQHEDYDHTMYRVHGFLPVMSGSVLLVSSGSVDASDGGVLSLSSGSSVHESNGSVQTSEGSSLDVALRGSVVTTAGRIAGTISMSGGSDASDTSGVNTGDIVLGDLSKMIANGSVDSGLLRTEDVVSNIASNDTKSPGVLYLDNPATGQFEISSGQSYGNTGYKLSPFLLLGNRDKTEGSQSQEFISSLVTRLSGLATNDDGSLVYTTDSYFCIRYDNIYQLESAAASVYLTPDMFFNAAVSILFDYTQIQSKLQLYVTKHVSEDKLHAVAKLLPAQVQANIPLRYLQ